MLANRLILTLALCSHTVCWAQSNQKNKQVTKCKPSPRIKGDLPRKPFKFLPGESYKSAPVVHFEIEEGGSVKHVRLVRSSGIKDLDNKLLKAVADWRYKPNPGCPIETDMTLTIHWQ
jgi:TonB family protein